MDLDISKMEINPFERDDTNASNKIVNESLNT